MQTSAKLEKFMAYQVPALDQKIKEIIGDLRSPIDKLERIYYFVRDSILFDLPADYFVSAGQVLTAGRGACMNKAVLLAEMARRAGVPARLHFMWVSKEALRDLVHPLAYRFWADPFLHTYPEVMIDGSWVSMEPTIDIGLYRILLGKSLNFARYPEHRNIPINFSPAGVVGVQQFAVVKESPPVYADDLEPLRQNVESLPKIKQLLMPSVLRMSSHWLNEKVRK